MLLICTVSSLHIYAYAHPHSSFSHRDKDCHSARLGKSITKNTDTSTTNSNNEVDTKQKKEGHTRLSSETNGIDVDDSKNPDNTIASSPASPSVGQALYIALKNKPHSENRCIITRVTPPTTLNTLPLDVQSRALVIEDDHNTNVGSASGPQHGDSIHNAACTANDGNGKDDKANNTSTNNAKSDEDKKQTPATDTNDEESAGDRKDSAGSYTYTAFHFTFSIFLAELDFKYDAFQCTRSNEIRVLHSTEIRGFMSGLYGLALKSMIQEGCDHMSESVPALAAKRCKL